MNNLDQYYRVLGLEPGASVEEVNQAYRDLAFIWHPDRVPKDNQRLQQKAQEKLKEINQARDELRSIQSSAHKRKRLNHRHRHQQPVTTKIHPDPNIIRPPNLIIKQSSHIQI